MGKLGHLELRVATTAMEGIRYGPPARYPLSRCVSQLLQALSPFPNGKLYFLFIRRGTRWHWEQSSVSYRILSLAVTLGVRK